MASYAFRLHAAIRAKRTPALVGLDPRFDGLPLPVIEAAKARSTQLEDVMASAFEEFCFRIIDVVSPLVPAVKPQSAFFEELGPEGVRVLQRIIRRARSAGLIVICDAKRGDIGSTAQAYAAAYLAGEDPDAAPFPSDAVTVNPYLGIDTWQPFVETARKRSAGLYVLVRTSNPGARDFQDLAVDSQPLYTHVGQAVERLSAEAADASGYGLVGAVVGATFPRELRQLRSLMPHAPLLVPGYASQGGTAADVAAAFDEAGLGAVVNNARGINFAHSRAPYAEQYGQRHWEQAVEAATKDMIAELAAHSAAGRLATNS